MAIKNLLVFDDDEDILEIFRFLFEDKGWDVTTFNDCARVVERARSTRPDLILMDNWIPPTGGIEATRLIKMEDDLQSIPVIYLSANNDIKDLASKAGSDAYLAKPFQFASLLEMAEGLVNKKA